MVFVVVAIGPCRQNGSTNVPGDEHSTEEDVATSLYLIKMGDAPAGGNSDKQTHDQTLRYCLCECWEQIHSWEADPIGAVFDKVHEFVDVACCQPKNSYKYEQMRPILLVLL